MPKGNRGGKGAVRPSADGVITATTKQTWIDDNPGMYIEEVPEPVYKARTDGNGTLYFEPASPEKPIRYQTKTGEWRTDRIGIYNLQAGWRSSAIFEYGNKEGTYREPDHGQFFGVDLTKAKKIVIPNSPAKKAIIESMEIPANAAGLYWSNSANAFISRRGYYFNYKAGEWLPSKYEQKYRNVGTAREELIRRLRR